MKRFNFMIAVFLIATLNAQPTINLDSLRSVAETDKKMILCDKSVLALLLNDSSKSPKELEVIETEFKERCTFKPTSNRKKLVQKIFYTVEHTYLKKYDSAATVNDIFKTGKFNCVGGVALMSIALTMNKIEHKIIETAHHVYIKLDIDKKSVLLETTDAENGFITSEVEIAKREQDYKAQSASSYIHLVKIALGNKSNEATEAIQKEISIKQVAALNYFNIAVNNYLQQNYSVSLAYLENASLLYPSNRINGMILLCMNKIIFHTDSSKETKDLMKKKTLEFQKVSNSLAFNIVKN